MLSSKRGYGETNKESILFFFYCDNFAEKLPLGKKNLKKKTSQKIPDMGIILEVRNPRNSSQGTMTQ